MTQGREVFKLAVRGMAESSLRVLHDAGVAIDDVRLVVPHQANLRIIEATARLVGIPMEKVFLNVENYGNTSASSISFFNPKFTLNPKRNRPPPS